MHSLGLLTAHHPLRAPPLCHRLPLDRRGWRRDPARSLSGLWRTQRRAYCSTAACARGQRGREGSSFRAETTGWWLWRWLSCRCRRWHLRWQLRSCRHSGECCWCSGARSRRLGIGCHPRGTVCPRHHLRSESWTRRDTAPGQRSRGCWRGCTQRHRRTRRRGGVCGQHRSQRRSQRRCGGPSEGTRPPEAEGVHSRCRPCRC